MKKRSMMYVFIIICQMMIVGCQNDKYIKTQNENGDVLLPYMILYAGNYYYYQGFQGVDDVNAYMRIGKMASSVDADCIPQQSLETNFDILEGCDVYLLEDSLFVIFDTRKYKFSKDDNYDINTIRWDLQPSVSYEGRNYYFQGEYLGNDDFAQKVGEITAVVPSYIKPRADFETNMDVLFECDVLLKDNIIYVVYSNKLYIFELKE